MNFLLLSLVILSCGADKKSTLEYRVAKDGLIYNTHDKNLFTGIITDTMEVVIEMEIVNGKKHGKFTTYYLNGNIEKQGMINQNHNEGEWKYYYDDGTLESVGHFKDDKPEGEWTFYYQNGIKKEAGIFKNGKRTGKWTMYDNKGEVINEQDFNTGEIPNSKNQSSLITS
jgi:hypothetical protein